MLTYLFYLTIYFCCGYLVYVFKLFTSTVICWCLNQASNTLIFVQYWLTYYCAEVSNMLYFVYLVLNICTFVQYLKMCSISVVTITKTGYVYGLNFLFTYWVQIWDLLFILFIF